MAFNSFEFAIFFLATFALYYTVRSVRSQTAVLLIASLIFYGWADPSIVWLLLSCVFINAALSWSVGGIPNKGNKAILVGLGVLINVSILAAYKYSHFAGWLAQEQLGLNLRDVQPLAVLMSLPLPIGISIYTIEAISLLVDSYRNSNAKTKFSTHLRDTAAFMTFFPNVVAGPIIRAGQFWPQINLKRFRDIPWDYCSTQLIIGYFLKVVIADDLAGQIASGFRYCRAESSLELLSTMLAVSVKIFSEFAGYAYIALGLAALLGYKLPINFNWPYCSKSLSEFWTRWQITFSQWLRDYLYIPLGGNRLGSVRTLINLMIVMLVGGIWYGAGVHFIIWGAMHGIALCAERIFGLRAEPRTLGGKALRSLAVFAFVTFAWLFFVLDAEHALGFCRHIVGNWNFGIYDPARLLRRLAFCAPVLVWHAVVWSREQGLLTRLPVFELPSWRREFALAVMLFMIVACPGDPDIVIFFKF